MRQFPVNIQYLNPHSLPWGKMNDTAVTVSSPSPELRLQIDSLRTRPLLHNGQESAIYWSPLDRTTVNPHFAPPTGHIEVCVFVTSLAVAFTVRNLIVFRLYSLPSTDSFDRRHDFFDIIFCTASRFRSHWSSGHFDELLYEFVQMPLFFLLPLCCLLFGRSVQDLARFHYPRFDYYFLLPLR